VLYFKTRRCETISFDREFLGKERMIENQSGNRSSLERAFQLADTGMSAATIRKTLTHEGLKEAQLNGPTLMRQLGERARAARAKAKAHGGAASG
jgi:hypothetical protein